MAIEILGTNYVNKGAELMARAIVAQLAARYPGVPVAQDFRVGSARQRRAAGLMHLATTTSQRAALLGTVAGAAASLLTASTRRRFHLVLPSEVRLVLDASGFAYSDQWGPRWAGAVARRLELAKARGARVVLLPQAFGPFTDPALIAPMRRIMDAADLVFARDSRSRDLLATLGRSMARVRLAPDFTTLVKVDAAGPAPDAAGGALIVPNYRMVDKGGDKGEAYLRFLEACVRAVVAETGMLPGVLVHDDRDDRKVAESLIQRTGHALRILHIPDPERAKAVIGASALVIGSRYHALVAALSQGVPTIGAGWTHKYRQLFTDYAVADCMLDVAAPPEQVEAVVASLCHAAPARRVRSVLRVTAERERRRAAEMWTQVWELADPLFPGHVEATQEVATWRPSPELRASLSWEARPGVAE
ncbi:MAG TPA: polysaccharide pyruvyl transferase family protein [Azospirillaceae bacterium]|nr:polysaccharide pyruvyl transferase family protein [Azospirillaceae bacterium]